MRWLLNIDIMSMIVHDHRVQKETTHTYITNCIDICWAFFIIADFRYV